MEDKARLDALEEMEEKLRLMEEGIADNEISTLDAMEKQLKHLESSLEKIRADYDPSLDGKIKLEFAGNKTEAYITITPPKIGGKRVTFDDVWELLNQEDIKRIDEQAIRKSLKYHAFHEKILIAKGAPSEHTGKEAYFAYQYGKEVVAEDKLEKTTIFEEVQSGQLVFYKVPPTYGKGGVSVTGKEIPPHPGNDIKITAGCNIFISEDGTRGYALTRGYVSWENDVVSIEKVKEIEGNADFMIGDINFKGKVHVHGSVSDDITINATGNIRVDGKVEDASLGSEGNIYVTQGISGTSTRKEIRAKGNIFAESMEMLTVTAGGNVIVNKNIINCNITANKVIITESGSRIERGKILAREVDAPNIGSKEKLVAVLNIQGKVSVSEKIYPTTKLTIENIDYPLSKEEEIITFITKEGKIEKIEYEQIPPVEEPLHYEMPKNIDTSTIIPFVVLKVSSLAEAKEKGAFFLGFSRDNIKIQEISQGINEEGNPIYNLRVFSKDIPEPYPWDSKEEVNVEPVDGYYRLIPANEGLYLTVYPPEGKGKSVEEEKILTEIKEKEYEEVNFQLLSETVKRATGAPIIIASKQHSDIDGQVIVNVSEGFTKASITMIPHQKGGDAVKFDDVIKSLKKQGVTDFIKTDVIKEALRDNKFNEPIVVAEELPPESGPDAKIEITIRTDTSQVELSEDDHGRVDFKEKSSIENVTKGQLLAILVPIESPGTPGKKINGEVIPPPPPQETKLPAGKNTKISEDGKELYATIDGQATYIANKINIEPIFEVKGNVNMATGNIDFLGTVIIKGSVLDGFKVKAEGDIQVSESVEAATLSAGANININGGVLGKNKASLFAEGDITAKFVENAHLTSKGSIIVSEFILHSFLDAGKAITVTEGNKGFLIGGKARASEEINAQEIGCSISTKTTVEVGISPRVREQLKQLEDIYQKDNKKFERIKLDIITLKNWQKEKGNLSQEKEQLLVKLIKLQNLLTMKLRSYAERKEILETQIARSDKGTINVIKSVYPGTIIAIRAATKTIKEVIKSTTFFFENNEINTKDRSEIQE
ncbi:MAG: FapA family protein [bacterium]|nr:FapA family protein [bacterium]